MKMRDIITLVENASAPMLTEGRDAPLFHFTSHLGKTLEANTLSPGSRAGGGISLTRNLSTPFYSYFERDDQDCLILNQTLLSQRYKITPMYGDSAEQLPSLLKKHTEMGLEIDPKDYQAQNEQEERLFGIVKPLNRYLLAIVIADDILDGVDMSMSYVKRASDDFEIMRIMRIGLYSKEFGIPLVERRSVKPNGTWTAEVTKPIRMAAAKIARRHAKDQAKAAKP